MKEQEKIFNAFASADVHDWERAAREELQGADPWKKLSRVENGISLKPFYSPGDAKGSSFHLPVARNSFLGPRTWYNCPLVSVGSPEKANAAALQHLKRGADGVFFELNDVVDFSALLNDIDWRHCALNFLANQIESSIATDLNAFLKKNYADARIVGGFFGNQKDPRPNHDSFFFVGHRTTPSTAPIEELASAIRAMKHVMNDRFSQATGVAFSMEIGSDLFLEIAKLRALRVIWDQVLTRKGIHPGKPLFIHARSRPWIEDSFSPHGNMLKGTTAAMASIMGGCDALTVEPETDDDAMMNRVTRNISNILREEAHFSMVADPLCGSYFIEDLTQQLVDGVLNLLATEANP